MNHWHVLLVLLQIPHTPNMTHVAMWPETSRPILEAFLYHSHHATNAFFEAITEMLTTIEEHPHHAPSGPVEKFAAQMP